MCNDSSMELIVRNKLIYQRIATALRVRSYVEAVRLRPEDEKLVSAPDPTDAAADGLHHRYAVWRHWQQFRGQPGRNFILTNQIAAMH